jgi:DNA repair exonuclease SbcCD ATPase subunit
LAEARAELQAQHERSLALEDTSLSASAQLADLQTSLTSRGSELAKLQADNLAVSERLQQAHDDVRGLQMRLRQVEEERDRHRASAEQLEKECGDLQLRISEKEAANANASLSVQDANSKSELLHQRLTELSSERAVLQERLESAEYRIAQLKAERDAKDVEATKAQRDKQRMAVDHAQEMDALRRQVAQEMAEAARKADAEYHASLLEEQKKRQRAIEDAHNGVNSDPRVLRAADLEAKNADLLRQIKATQDDTQNKLAENAREVRDLKAQVDQSRRLVEELRHQEEHLRAALASKEENAGETASSMSRIKADYVHFVQSSETWLRELMQKVALLTSQKLYGDYLLGHKHREEVFELRGQLRQVRLTLEQVNEDFNEAVQKREAAEVALENEQKINKELLERQTQGSSSDLLGLSRGEVKALTNRRDPNSRSFGNRDIFISPERHAVQTSRGTLSDMAQDQEAISADANEQLHGQGLRANRALLDDDRFVLETREELVSSLCKQDLRCDAALEDASELYRMWRAAMTTTELLSRGGSVVSDVATSPLRGGGGEGMVQTPRHHSSPPGPMPTGSVRFRSDVDVDSFTEKVVDVIEVTQSVCTAHADLIRSLLTEREKTLVKFNKAAVA